MLRKTPEREPGLPAPVSHYFPPKATKHRMPGWPVIQMRAKEAEPGMAWLKQLSSQENQLEWNIHFCDPSSSNLTVAIALSSAAELNRDFASTFATANQNRTWMLRALSACRRAG
eukprot:4951986-Amphidinium_carterae.1